MINPLQEPEMAFEVSFPNSFPGVFQQSDGNAYRFFLLKEEKCHAVFNAFVEDKKAISPLKSTFGGIEFNLALEKEAIEFFVNGIHSYMTSNGIINCRLTNPPDYFYAEKAEWLQQVLIDKGFRLVCTDENYKIAVNHNPFSERIHLTEKRKLKKCREAGFTFQQEEGIDLKLVHDFISRSRARKSYPMTMPLGRFVKVIGSDKEKYQVFTVRSAEGALAALAVTVRFRSDILYHFYPADNGDLLNYSPSVLLHAGLYQYCQQHHIPLLDLGIATDKGVRNDGLSIFKNRLGASMDHKHIFQADFC